MTFSKSLPKGQIPALCRLCDTNNQIRWKCEMCEIMIKSASEHKVIHIKDVGKPSDEPNFSVL